MSIASIPKKRWLIPLPSLRKEDEDRGFQNHPTYSQMKGLLENVGFKLVRENIAHNFEYEHTKETELYALWQHPSGILFTANTCHATSEKNADFPSRKISAGHMALQVDLGVGIRLPQWRFLKGSSTSEPTLDGRNIRISHASVDGRAHLLDILDEVQRKGRIVPFSEWRQGMIPYLSPSLCADIPPSFKKKDRKERYLIGEYEEWRKGYRELLTLAPAELKPIIEQSFRHHVNDPRNENTDTCKEEAWRTVEDSIDYLSNTLQAAGKRYPSKKQKERFQCWSRAGLIQGKNEKAMDDDEFEKVMNDAFIHPFEKGESNLASAMVQLLNDNRHKTPASPVLKRLTQVLERAPEKTLLQWLTTPDAQGYTLGLYLLIQLAKKFQKESHEQEENKKRVLSLLNIILTRVGPENLRTDTDTHSALGLILEHQDSADNKTVFPLMDIRDWLKKRGVCFDEKLRWTEKTWYSRQRKHILKYHEETLTSQNVADIFKIFKGTPFLEKLTAEIQAHEIEHALDEPKKSFLHKRRRI